MEIFRKALGEDHPDYAASLSNLGVLYLVIGDYARAAPLFKEALDRNTTLIRSTASAVGERQWLQLVKSLRDGLDPYASVALDTGASAQDLYRHVLDWKGAADARQSEARLSRDQPELKPVLEQLCSDDRPACPTRLRQPVTRSAVRLAQAARRAPRAERELRGGSGGSKRRVSPAEAEAARRSRRGGRSPARQDRPDRSARVLALPASQGRQGKAPTGAAVARLCLASWPPGRPCAAGRGPAHRRGGRGVAAGVARSSARCSQGGRRGAGRTGLGAAAQAPGRRPDSPDRRRRLAVVLPIRGFARQQARIVSGRRCRPRVRRLGPIGHRGAGRSRGTARARAAGDRRTSTSRPSRASPLQRSRA